MCACLWKATFYLLPSWMCQETCLKKCWSSGRHKNEILTVSCYCCICFFQPFMCSSQSIFFSLSVFCNLFLCQRELVTPPNKVRFKINLTSCIPLMLELVYNLASPLFCCLALYTHRGRWNPKKVTVCQNNKLSYITCAWFHRNHCTEVRWVKEPRGRCISVSTPGGHVVGCYINISFSFIVLSGTVSSSYAIFKAWRKKECPCWIRI